MARDLYTGMDTVVVVENSSVAYISRRPFELASGHVCWAGGLPACVCVCVLKYFNISHGWFGVI